MSDINLKIFQQVNEQALKQQIASLQKQLDYYKRLESNNQLIVLPCSLTAPFYRIKFSEVEQVYYLEEGQWQSAQEILNSKADIEQEAIYISKEKAQKQLKKLNRSQTTPATACLPRESVYTPRSELDELTRETKRKQDREYYAQNAEALNQKDRDKYHRLHPNARHYKKRDKSKQLSIDDLVSCTTSEGETE